MKICNYATFSKKSQWCVEFWLHVAKKAIDVNGRLRDNEGRWYFINRFESANEFESTNWK